MFTRTQKTTVSDADMQKLVNAANSLNSGDPITLKEVEAKPRLARYLLNGADKALQNVRAVKEKKTKTK
jgi:hypothetical protein